MEIPGENHRWNQMWNFSDRPIGWSHSLSHIATLPQMVPPSVSAIPIIKKTSCAASPKLFLFFILRILKIQHARRMTSAARTRFE